VVTAAARFHGAIPLLACLICSGCSRTNQPEAATVPLQLDGRRWVAVQKNVRHHAGGDFIREYLPTGQTVADWKEIVTVQEFSTAMAKHPISARDFEAAFMNDLKKDTAHLDSNVLKDSDQNLLIAWKAQTDAKLGNENGLVRITQGPQSVDVIQYTSREALTEEQMKRWQAILANTQLDEIVR